jgi:hypothetical protein
VGELRQHGQPRGGPDGPVDVGVDRLDDLVGGDGPGVDRRPDLLQPLLAVREVALGGGRGVGELGTVTGQDGERASSRSRRSEAR